MNREEFINATLEEQDEFIKSSEEIYKQQEHLHFQSRLDSEYDRVIDLLFHKDKNTNKANDCVILVSSTKTPFFNPNYNLIFDYFKKLEYSIFTSWTKTKMVNYKYEYSTKTWFKSENGNYFPIEVHYLPNVLVHKRTHLDKIQFKQYLSI